MNNYRSRRGKGVALCLEWRKIKVPTEFHDTRNSKPRIGNESSMDACDKKNKKKATMLHIHLNHGNQEVIFHNRKH